MPIVDSEDASRSLLARWMRRAREGARHGWRQLPAGALRRWILITAVGAALSFLLTFALTLAAKRQIPGSGLERWDRQVIGAARDDWPISFTDAIILESPGNILVMLPLTLGAAALLLRHARVLPAASLLACYLVARFLIWFGWGLWERARPDLVAGGAAALSAHSFPSGHILLVFTTYGLLAWLWIRATASRLERALAICLLASLAIIVTAARLRLGAHWPTDMIGGAVIGLFWLACNIMALEWAAAAAPRAIAAGDASATRSPAAR